MVVRTELGQQEIDRVFHALADATRRDILIRVLERELSVSVLARAYPVSMQAVQKHVGVLEHAGLVGKTRHGREQRVHGDPQRLHAAGVLLDHFESVWRHRIAAMDVLLQEDSDPTEKE